MKHALVIEDNHLISIMLEEVLPEHGYQSVQIATSQKQAIEFAKARRPDLITVDDKFDSGTSVDTIREICSDRAIPVVFITASPALIRSSIAGAIIVPKPFWIPQLTAGIEAALHSPTAC